MHLPWIPLRRDCLNPFTPAHQVFMYMEMFPPALPTLLFSRLNTPSSPRFPSCERRSNPLIIFEVVCWTCQECPCCTGSVTEDIVSGELVVLGKWCLLYRARAARRWAEAATTRGSCGSAWCRWVLVDVATERTLQPARRHMGFLPLWLEQC